MKLKIVIIILIKSLVEKGLILSMWYYVKYFISAKLYLQ